MMWNVIIPAFATLFVIIDPIGLTPVFVGLTKGTDQAHRRKMALRGVMIGGTVLLFFAFMGSDFLNMLGIDLSSFRIAGGAMLFLIAVEMVFQRRSSRRSESANKVAEEITPDDISVFPIAIPLISGPGAITSIMLLMGEQAGNFQGQMTVLAVLGVVLLIVLTLFFLSERLEKIMGKTISEIFTRLLGILLAALAVQFIIDGLLTAFH